MKRKSPIRHVVKSHKRQGKLIHSFIRGKGQKQRKKERHFIKYLGVKKIISGGQSGADLAGNFFALEVGIPTEINVERNYKPLYDPKPMDVTINEVSMKTGREGGWVERRRYNIQNSDATLIFVGRPIEHTIGSRGTLTDTKRMKKPVFVVDVSSPDIVGLKSFLFKTKPKILNIAGERNLNKITVKNILHKTLGE